MDLITIYLVFGLDLWITWIFGIVEISCDSRMPSDLDLIFQTEGRVRLGQGE